MPAPDFVSAPPAPEEMIPLMTALSEVEPVLSLTVMVRAPVPREKTLLIVTMLSAMVEPRISEALVGRKFDVMPHSGVPVKPLTVSAPP